MKEEVNKYVSKYTSAPKCPYCGFMPEVDTERFAERQDEENEIECEECGKEFIYTTDYEITYCSYRK